MIRYAVVGRAYKAPSLHPLYGLLSSPVLCKSNSMEQVSKESPDSKHPETAVDKESIAPGIATRDLIDYHGVDPALAAKMTLLNQVGGKMFLPIVG